MCFQLLKGYLQVSSSVLQHGFGRKAPPKLYVRPEWSGAAQFFCKLAQRNIALFSEFSYPVAKGHSVSLHCKMIRGQQNDLGMLNRSCRRTKSSS